VDTLLQKYDRNKDGALDASELRAFALDLQK
jgi:Ca2+-binding EF-hand superfamily protein